jgi:ribosome-associated toxin RatA of RatAB toxin-antitoxin module
MSQVVQSVLVMHPVQRMFDLVDGVEAYPEFLPWCGGVQVKERTDTVTEARIDINFHGVKAHFHTRNLKSPNHMLIALVDGPFKRFEGEWVFTPLSDEACKVELRLHWEFSTRLLEKVIGPVFNRIASTFVQSFERRADQLFGEGG